MFVAPRVPVNPPSAGDQGVVSGVVGASWTPPARWRRNRRPDPPRRDPPSAGSPDRHDPPPRAPRTRSALGQPPERWLRGAGTSAGPGSRVRRPRRSRPSVIQCRRWGTARVPRRVRRRRRSAPPDVAGPQRECRATGGRRGDLLPHRPCPAASECHSAARAVVRKVASRSCSASAPASSSVRSASHEAGRVTATAAAAAALTLGDPVDDPAHQPRRQLLRRPRLARQQHRDVVADPAGEPADDAVGLVVRPPLGGHADVEAAVGAEVEHGRDAAPAVAEVDRLDVVRARACDGRRRACGPDVDPEVVGHAAPSCDRRRGSSRRHDGSEVRSRVLLALGPVDGARPSGRRRIVGRQWFTVSPSSGRPRSTLAGVARTHRGRGPDARRAAVDGRVPASRRWRTRTPRTGTSSPR